MSRNWTPLRVGSLQVTALLAAFCLVCASPASAQRAGSSTVFGLDSREAQDCERFTAELPDPPAAIAACTEALEDATMSHSMKMPLFANRGVSHMRLGAYDDALADFEHALEIEPENAEVHLNRGSALVQAGRPGPAVAVLTRSLSLGVTQAYKAYYLRAAARERLGDLRGAFEDYSTALEIRPEWPPAEAQLERFIVDQRTRLETIIAEENADPNENYSRY